MVSVWAVCSPSQAEVLLRFVSAISTLSRISDLHICCSDRGSIPPSVLSTSPPKTSLVGVVDHTCQLHLHVQVRIGLLLHEAMNFIVNELTLCVGLTDSLVFQHWDYHLTYCE